MARKVKLTETVKQVLCGQWNQKKKCGCPNCHTIWIQKIVQGQNLPIHKVLQEALWPKEEAEDAVQSEI